MRKKVIAKRAPREKIYKPPTKPSTRSQDRTFTPSPSPPTSPPRCDPMARTKNTLRFPASAKPTPPPKATPSKPASSKPGSSKPPSSKGKRPATEEPVPEPQQPRARSVPVRSQRGGGSVKQNKGPTRSERVVLDDEDEDFVPEDSTAPSTEGTSISTGKKSTLLNVVRDVAQESRLLLSRHVSHTFPPLDVIVPYLREAGFDDTVVSHGDVAVGGTNAGCQASSGSTAGDAEEGVVHVEAHMAAGLCPPDIPDGRSRDPPIVR
nr:gibberellin-regulated protein 14-like [Arachis hypogaea]